MVDIARLALEIDSRSASKASRDLDGLSRSSKRAEGSVDTFTSKTNAGLAALGRSIGVVAAGFLSISAGRSIIQANLQIEKFNNALIVGTGSAQAAAEEMKFLRQQSEELGLNLEVSAGQFAKLSAAAKGTALQGQATRDIFTSIAKASTVLGLSTDEAGGALTAIQQIISKGTVSAEELRGQLGERLPGAFQIAARSIGATTQELGEMLQKGEVIADDFLPAFARELEKTFGDQAEKAAQGLNAQLNRMETAFFDLKVAIGQTGIVDFFSDAIQGATKFLNVLTQGIGVSQQSAIEKQVQLIANMREELASLNEKKNIPFGEIFLFDKRQADFLEQRIEDATEDLAKMQAEAQKTAESVNVLAEETGDLGEELGNFPGSGGGGGSGGGIRKLADDMDKMRKAVFDLTLQHDPLARMNAELADLIRLRENVDIRDDIFDAAATESINRYIDSLEKVEEETEKVADVTKETGSTFRQIFDSAEQTAISAARNIQSAFANFLFNPFKDGLGGLFENFANVLRRMVAEVAASRILQGAGFAGLFGLSGSAAASGGATNFAGGFSNAFGLGGLLSGGSLANSLATSSLGQFLGLSHGIGGAAGGLPILTNAGASFSSFASTALPTIGAGALGIGIGSTIAGDKKIFGVNGTVTSAAGAAAGAAIGSIVPGIGTAIGAGIGGVLGGAVSGLFGRGPLKQKETTLLGDVTGEGFEGAVSTRFKAKGGAFRSSKTDNVILDVDTGELLNGFGRIAESGISDKLLPFADEAREQILQIGQVLDATIQGFNQNLRSTADVLGLSATALDGFKRTIDIASASGESLTDQQIAQVLGDVGDHMANVLLPGLQDMVRDGETAVTALNRLKGEFLSLEDALIVFGVSAQEANAAISALSIATRTELVDAAGGIDALNSKVTFFANNFLTAEEQLDIGFAKLDAEMQALGLSADITVEEFKNLVISVTQAGGASVELASSLLNLAPQFLNVKRAEEQVAAESARASGQLSGLAGSISNVASASTASFQRIDNARAALENARRGLATAEAQASLSGAQNELSRANEALSTARSNLATAQSAEQGRISNEINTIVSERNELINAYQQEASALKSVVDRFSALSGKILDFKDSLNIGNLSPFSPGEQLAIARQQFNATRGLAAQGDEGALDRLPEVSRTFLEASQTFNGATGAFESDFNFVQQVLESSGATARATRDIASEQLAGIEGTISQLQALNEAAQAQANLTGQINSGIGKVNDSMLSVEDAMAAVESATADVVAAQANVDDATAAVEQAVIDQTGAVDEVGQATLAVERAVREMSAAVLQGFGNSFIRDQQIRDFVIANQNFTDQQFAQIAVASGISGPQLARSLAPLGVSQERINVATGGLSVRNDQIASIVDQKLADGDFIGIYNLARANGITSERLASASALNKEEINQFVSASGLQPFERGTDLITKTGPIFAHKGEGITPSSVPGEIKKLREELAELRQELNQQMSALINTNIQANADNAQTIAKSNERLAVNANWQNRSRPKVA